MDRPPATPHPQSMKVISGSSLDSPLITFD
jgi:hypothetical protein